MPLLAQGGDFVGGQGGHDGPATHGEVDRAGRGVDGVPEGLGLQAAAIPRDTVIQLAKENGLPVEEDQWPPETLEKVDEIFITGALKKIMPVTQLDGHAIGNGKPGPVTQKLMRLYKEYFQSLNHS